MRKSAREKRQIELFSPARAEVVQLKKSKYATEDEDEASDPETDRDDDYEHDEDKVAKTSKTTINSKPVRRKNVTQNQTGDEELIIDKKSNCKLFDEVRSSKKISIEVERWVASHQINRIKAHAEIMNFVLLSAGSEKAWIKSDVDLEGLEPEELDELLSDMIDSMVKSGGGASQKYPLSLIGKQNKSYRQRYIQFWEQLTTHYCTHTTSTSTSTSTNSTTTSSNRDNIGVELTVICELLISCSSMTLAAIRDAVTEACLSICGRLLNISVELKREIDVANRQLLGVKRGSGTGHGTSSNAKYDSIMKQKTLTEKKLETFLSLSTMIFNSLFQHRYKDSNDNIRAMCIKHLGQWIFINNAEMFKDEYLKYIAWMLSDRALVVRQEAVRTLCVIVQDELNATKLELFVERFIDRFIEIAVGDVDSSISLDMIGVLRRLQQIGLLDGCDQSQMDRVDEIVFDEDADFRCRQEALLFVMDHTEGFDDTPVTTTATATATGNSVNVNGGNMEQSMANEMTTKNNNKRSNGATDKSNKKRKSPSTTAAAAAKNKNVNIDVDIESAVGLARRQRTARQLETMVEFTAYHLEDTVTNERNNKNSSSADNDSGGSDGDSVLDRGIALLVEAFHGLPNEGILCDWSTIFSLLLREGDGLVSTSLAPLHISILLRILVNSYLHLQELYRESNRDNENTISTTTSKTHRNTNNIHSSGGVGTGGSNKKYASGGGGYHRRMSVSAGSDWEALGEQLARDLPRLLVRFRDDKSNLIELARLLNCESLTSTLETSRPLVIKSLLKITIEIFNSINDEKLLLQITNGLKQWSTIKGTIGVTTRDMISKLLSESMEKSSVVLHELNDFNNFNKSMQEDIITSTSHGNSRRKSNKGRTSSSSDIQSKITIRDDNLLTLCGSITRMSALWKTIDCRPMVSAQKQNTSVEQCVEDIAQLLVEVADTLLEYSIGNHNQTSTSSIELALTKDQISKCLSNMATYQQQQQLQGRKDKSEDDNNDDNMWEEYEDTNSVSITSIISLRDMLIDVLHTWMTLDVQLQLQHSQDNEHDYTSSSITSKVYKSNHHCHRFDLHRLRREAFRLISDMRLLFPESLLKYAVVNKLVWWPSQEIISSMRIVFEEEGNTLREIRQAAAIICHWTIKSSISSCTNNIQEIIKTFAKIIKDNDPIKYLEIQMIALKSVYSEHVVVHKQRVEHCENTEEALQAEDDEKIGVDVVLELAKKLSQSLGVGKLQGGILSAFMNFLRAGLDFTMNSSNNIGFLYVLSIYLRFLPSSHLVQLEAILDEKIENATVEVQTSLQDARESNILDDFKYQLSGSGKRKISPVKSKQQQRVQSPPQRRVDKRRIPENNNKVAKSNNNLYNNNDDNDDNNDEEDEENVNKIKTKRSRTNRNRNRSIEDDEYEEDILPISLTPPDVDVEGEDRISSYKPHGRPMKTGSTVVVRGGGGNGGVGRVSASRSMSASVSASQSSRAMGTATSQDTAEWSADMEVEVEERNIGTTTTGDATGDDDVTSGLVFGLHIEDLMEEEEEEEATEEVVDVGASTTYTTAAKVGQRSSVHVSRTVLDDDDDEDEDMLAALDTRPSRRYR
eukprot:gene7904-16177_t